MSSPGFQPRKGVSPWLPVGFLFWVITMLTIFVAFYLAGGQGLGGLSFGDALVYVLLRMLVIMLIFAPVLLGGFTVWLGYRFLIKKKLKPASNRTSETSPSSSPEPTHDK
jgi:hypothetical protein